MGDNTRALTRVTYLQENKNENLFSDSFSRKRRSIDNCNPNRECCRMRLGRLKKRELEEMVTSLFGEQHRQYIKVVTTDMDIYTCYSRTTKCSLPTFVGRTENTYSNEELWHKKHVQAGYGGCCQADSWDRMKIQIVDESNNSRKYLLNGDLMVNPTSCSCGVRSATPSKKKRR